MATTDLVHQKQRWRRVSNARRLARQSRTCDSQLVDQLTQLLEELGVAETVATYEPFRSEPAVGPAAAWLEQQGVQVLVPSLDFPASQDFPFVTSTSGAFQCATGALADPVVEAVIVPGLAFGLDGARLGRGGGWYDRALEVLAAQEKPPVLIGVCFDDEVHKSGTIPMGDLDAPVDWVVTPNRRFRAL